MHVVWCCVVFVLCADTMFEYLDIPKTIVNQRLFGSFSDPHFSGRITFVPFVASLWHFLSFNNKW
jgi:hypothetical protein